MKYLQVKTENPESHYIVAINDLFCINEDITCAAENDENTTWTLGIIDMTEEEFEKLPDFEGVF